MHPDTRKLLQPLPLYKMGNNFHLILCVFTQMGLIKFSETYAQLNGHRIAAKGQIRYLPASKGRV